MIKNNTNGYGSLFDIVIPPCPESEIVKQSEISGNVLLFWMTTSDISFSQMKNFIVKNIYCKELQWLYSY